MDVNMVEGGVGRLQSPTFLFQLSDLISIGSLWTWGAVVLATIAAFRSLIRKSRNVFDRLRSVQTVLSDSTFFDDDSWSSCSPDENSEDGTASEDEEEEEVLEVDRVGDEWRWTRSDLWLEELVSGKDVVKSWEKDDRVGAKPEFEESSWASWDFFSLCDWSRDEVVQSFGSPQKMTFSAAERDSRCDAAGLRQRVTSLGTRGESKVVYLSGAVEFDSVAEFRKKSFDELYSFT